MFSPRERWAHKWATVRTNWSTRIRRLISKSWNILNWLPLDREDPIKLMQLKTQSLDPINLKSPCKSKDPFQQILHTKKANILELETIGKSWQIAYSIAYLIAYSIAHYILNSINLPPTQLTGQTTHITHLCYVCLCCDCCVYVSGATYRWPLRVSWFFMPTGKALDL
jgi:hypothetical protein